VKQLSVSEIVATVTYSLFWIPLLRSAAFAAFDTPPQPHSAPHGQCARSALVGLFGHQSASLGVSSGLACFLSAKQADTVRSASTFLGPRIRQLRVLLHPARLMASLKLEFKILLSSPSDLSDERRIASEVVTEISSTWGNPNSVTLKLLSWENDVTPGFASEPQEVINDQLGDSWDIYLGIMHARFGTPTRRFGSGTEEEFETAYKLWQSDSEKRSLMFYFKKAPIEIDADPEQLRRVQEFKKRVSNLGGLYREFSDGSGFKDLLRAHLTAVLVDLHKKQGQTTPLAIVTGATDKTPDDQLPGFLDLIEDGTTALNQVTAAVEGMGTIMTNSTAEVVKQSERFKEVSALGDLQTMRKCVSSISKNMLETARAIGDRRRDYGTASRIGFESLSTAISLAKGFSSGGIGDINSFANTISGTMGMLESFVATIYGTERSLNTIPNIAKEFSFARMSLNKELASLRSELNASLSLMRDLRNVLQN
jgi:hypothetical protein